MITIGPLGWVCAPVRPGLLLISTACLRAVAGAGADLKLFPSTLAHQNTNSSNFHPCLSKNNLTVEIILWNFLRFMLIFSEKRNRLGAS